jgi:hypothetical protein
MRVVRGLVPAALFASSLAGCTYYEVAPGTYATAPVSTFDRSWAASRNAMQEQGVRITQEDRATGTLRGDRSGITVQAHVNTQADGSVRVQFGTIGATSVDPQLVERISSSYDRLMGR